jgi:hypothetical protein
MQAQIIPIVGGAIVGLLPTILTAIVSWLNARSIQARRTQALALAQQRIAFLSDWIKAQEDLSTPEHLDQMKSSVSDELSAMRVQLADVLEDHRRPVDLAAERTFFQKLFLIYTPRSVGAWVFHTLFFMSVGMTAIMILLTAFRTLDPLDTAIACLDLPGLILSVVFRQLAVEADKRAQQALKPVPAVALPGEAPASSVSPAAD